MTLLKKKHKRKKIILIKTRRDKNKTVKNRRGTRMEKENFKASKKILHNSKSSNDINIKVTQNWLKKYADTPNRTMTTDLKVTESSPQIQSICIAKPPNLQVSFYSPPKKTCLWCVYVCVFGGFEKHMKILQEPSASLMVNKVILFKVDKQQTKQKTKHYHCCHCKDENAGMAMSWCHLCDAENSSLERNKRSTAFHFQTGNVRMTLNTCGPRKRKEPGLFCWLY